MGINIRVCGFADLGIVGASAHVSVHDARGLLPLVEVVLLGQGLVNNVVVDKVQLLGILGTELQFPRPKALR